MCKKSLLFLVSFFLCSSLTFAQPKEVSEYQKRADIENSKGNTANARSLYIRAYDDYARKGAIRQSVECGAKATSLYYKDNLYKEAFEFLHHVDQVIASHGGMGTAERSICSYIVTKERFQMYMKLRKGDKAKEQMNALERLAGASASDSIQNDLLYNKAIYYYSFGMTEQGNQTFKQMASRLTASKEYNKVDEVYQTLIANGRKSNNANLVAQSYRSYILWKDSVAALKFADKIDSLQHTINAHEASIAEQDDMLSSRQAVIIGLGILALILAVVLVLGAIMLLRFIALTRKQKSTIKMVNENNALKAKFISNISAQLNPALNKLDASIPEVKALLDFSHHVQTLSELECATDEVLDTEDVQMATYSESLMDQIRDKVHQNVTLTVTAPKMTTPIHKDYVTHILMHLLTNAAQYTPEGGSITIEFKKRSVHKYQFLVSNTGSFIEPDKQENVFKPFVEVRDLTQGDGLGLPICKQMAVMMGGDLTIDADFTKGTRFVLTLFA